MVWGEAGRVAVRMMDGGGDGTGANGTCESLLPPFFCLVSGALFIA